MTQHEEFAKEGQAKANYKKPFPRPILRPLAAPGDHQQDPPHDRRQAKADKVIFRRTRATCKLSHQFKYKVRQLPHETPSVADLLSNPIKIR
jgi:hypothetical protein